MKSVPSLPIPAVRLSCAPLSVVLLLLSAAPSSAQNTSSGLPTGRSSEPGSRLSTSVERPRVPAGLALTSGPLALLDPAVDLEPTILRRLALTEAAVAARSDAVKQLETLTRRPNLREWCLTDVSVSAQRRPVPAEVRRLGEDPVLTAWLTSDLSRQSLGLGRLAASGDWPADDPILVRAELEVAPPTPLKPPLAKDRLAEPYRSQFAALLATRRASLGAAVAAGRVRTVALLCECELDRSLPGAANLQRVADINKRAAEFLEYHLVGAGLKVVAVKRASPSDPDDRVLDDAGRAGADALLMVRFRELEGSSTGTRCKSSGLAELAFFSFGSERYQQPRRELLGSAALPFSTRDTLESPSLAADGFVQTAAAHLLAEGRVLQVFSELLIAQWKADAHRD